MSGPSTLADRIVESVVDLVACATGERCPAAFVRSLERLVEAEVVADARRSVDLLEVFDEGPVARVVLAYDGAVPPAVATERMIEAARPILEDLAHAFGSDTPADVTAIAEGFTPTPVPALSAAAKKVLAEAAAHDHELDLAEADAPEATAPEVERLPDPAAKRARAADLTAEEIMAAAALARGWRSVARALGLSQSGGAAAGIARRAAELGIAAVIEGRPGWGKPGRPSNDALDEGAPTATPSTPAPRPLRSRPTSGPIAAALQANGHGNVFGCTSCEFVAGRLDELGRHTIARHGRQIAAIERTPLDDDEIAERAS